MKKVLIFVAVFVTCMILTSMSLVKASTMQIKYTIKKNDTYYSLAKRFETTVDALVKLNPGVDPNKLKVGLKVNVQPSANIMIHRVVNGDTLYKISNKFNVSMYIIAQKNGIRDIALIYAGDTLAIPKTVETKLYFIKSFPTEFKLVAESSRINAVGNIYVNTMKALVAGPKTNDLYMPIPQNTAIHSVKLIKGITYVDFSKEVLNLNVGSEGEGLTLLCIANTLTENNEVKGVVLYVDGQKLDTLGGHIELVEPLKRDLRPVIK